MLNKGIKNVILPLIMLVMLTISSSYAQVQDTRPQENDMNRQNAERWTETLNTRLNLTDDQRTRVNSILMDYQTRKSQLGATSDPMTLQNDVNRQIEGVLDDNQRTNWDAYSTAWWTEINRGAGTDIDINRQSPDHDTDMDTDTDDDALQDKDTSGTKDTELPGDDDER
jgi:hypothetical protein